MNVRSPNRVLAEAWHESGELRAWLAQEAAWLDGLERRLRPRHPQPQRLQDAEEIADELYVSVGAARARRSRTEPRVTGAAVAGPGGLRGEPQRGAAVAHPGRRPAARRRAHHAGPDPRRDRRPHRALERLALAGASPS